MARKKYGIVVEPQYCLGCGICVTACKLENGLAPDYDDKPAQGSVSWNQVISISEGTYPDIKVYHIPMHCNHCENPPCLPACPQSAISRRDDGIVLISADKCNGCDDQPDKLRKCISACPYGAVQFNEKKGVAQACTLCAHRIDAGQEPACTRACLGRCLTFGDMNDPGSKAACKAKSAGKNLSTLKAEAGTRPGVVYANPPGVDVAKISPLARVEPIYGYKSRHAKPTS